MRFHLSSTLRKSTVGLVLAVVAACVLIGINEAGHARSAAALDNMARQFGTRFALNQLLQHVLDTETGVRGFLLTGDPQHLEPYERAAGAVDRSLAQLHDAYANTDELPAEAALDRNVRTLLADLDGQVRTRRQGTLDPPSVVALAGSGKRQMDAIRDQAAQLRASTATRIEASQAQVRRALSRSRLAIALATLAALAAFALYLRQSAALARAREGEQAALQQERDHLELQVRERTATLAELATHLQQVREDERGHLARELHDELGALLTAAKLDVARLKSRLGVQAPEIGERLQHLSDNLNSGIALKRRIIEDLRPSSLSNLGLTASLEILAREFSERSGIEVVTKLEPVELDEADQLTAYRVVQESLTNMARHAGAHRAEVSVHGHDGEVEVVVRDDGQGFDVSREKTSSHGLAGMRHRVEAAGGRLAVDAAPGRGTRIAAVLPARTTKSA